MATLPLTKPRADFAAHRRATATEFPKVVETLVSLIGRKLTAYIASVKDARAIDRWLENAKPQKNVEQRIRLAYHVASMLAEFDSPAVIQAWRLDWIRNWTMWCRSIFFVEAIYSTMAKRS